MSARRAGDSDDDVDVYELTAGDWEIPEEWKPRTVARPRPSIQLEEAFDLMPPPFTPLRKRAPGSTLQRKPTSR
jgi:hypothetical protein